MFSTLNGRASSRLELFVGASSTKRVGFLPAPNGQLLIREDALS